MLEWHTPWFLLLALQPLLLLLLRMARSRHLLDRYASHTLQPWVIPHSRHQLRDRLLSKNTLYLIAWLLFAIAAAGPRIAEDTASFDETSGHDVVILLDISQSMQVNDVGQTRLQLARRKIDYLNQQPGNRRLAIVTFAAHPHVYLPLSHDRQAVSFYINNLEILKAPTQGSRVELGLHAATNLLDNRPAALQQRKASILLLSDADFDSLPHGNNLALGYPVDSLLLASRKGDAVPAYREGWLSENGSPVVSQPDITSLRELSTVTGGRFITTQPHNGDIDEFVNITNARHTATAVSSTRITSWQELYPWFLFPAILLLFITLLPYRLVPSRYTSMAFVSLLFIISVVLYQPPAHATGSSLQQKALSALQQGDYELAQHYYDGMNGYDRLFGKGVVAYRREDFPRAIRLFEQALLDAENDMQRGATLFNLGNSHFRQGNYPAAITSYRDSLLYTPTATQAISNMQLAMRIDNLVEQSLAREGLATRAGRGPRSARAVEGIEIIDNSSVSLADDETGPTTGSQQDGSNKPDAIPGFLILKGLEYARSTGQTSSRISPSQHKIKEINLRDVDRIQDDQPGLWRRIFEAEEGYAAPVDEPRQLQGVRPW